MWSSSAVALPADLAQGVASALGSQLPVQQPAPPSALLVPTPRELPPPIGTPAELAEELAALLEGQPTVEPVALERLLAAWSPSPAATGPTWSTASTRC
jgi:hypothetical protein